MAATPSRPTALTLAAALAVAAVLALAVTYPASAAMHVTGHRAAGGGAALTLADEAAVVQRGLRKAAAAGRVTGADAARYSSLLRSAVAVAPTLPPLRGEVLTAFVGDLAVAAPVLDRPRALTVFTALQLNLDRLTASPIPRSGTDTTDADGIVYRWFAGRGYRFHPLANFAALNDLALKRDTEGVARLGAALLARAEPARGGLVWEYWFPFDTGKAPWVSGMSEAVAAQALSRAATAGGDPALMDAARAAARAFTSLTMRLPAGPWVRLYSFSKEVVLNAQLQTALSLDEYAVASGDAAGRRLAARMRAAVTTLLPRFDTGAWSLYSLGGAEADPGYHQFVIDLLDKTASQTGDPAWLGMADRFAAYQTQPPVLSAGRAPEVAYPLPADGFRDDVVVRFSVSKRSKVALVVDGVAVDGGTVGYGPNALRWSPGTAAAPGEHRAKLVATGLGGRTVTLPLAPLEVRRDLRAPVVATHVEGRWLAWKTDDGGTPWLRLRLVLRQGARVLTADLGRRATSGALALPVPPGTWRAELIATNSAGKARRVELGAVTRPPR